MFEKTGNVNHLCYLPIGFLFKRKISNLLLEIRSYLGDEGNDELQKEKHRLKSYYRIEQLIILYEAMRNLLYNKVEIDSWLKRIGRKPRGNYANLKIYKEKIEATTGIKVKTMADLDKLRKQIEFWSAKYSENFKEVESKGVTFMQIVISVFIGSMRTSIDYKMKLVDFFALKELSDGRDKRDNK